MPFRETIRGPQRRPSFVGEYRFAGKRLPGGDGCMAVSRTDGFSDQVRAWLAECLPRAIVYARSLVRDAGEADDVVQECVYRLLRRSATRDDKRHLIVYTKEDSAGIMQQFAARLVDGKSVVAQLKSCEPVNGGCGTFGRSWFTAHGGDDKDQDTSIWLLGFDKNGHHIVRRLDDGAITGKAARRRDSESYVADRELFIYYTLVGQGPAQLHRCRANIADSSTKPAGSVSRTSLHRLSPPSSSILSGGSS